MSKSKWSFQDMTKLQRQAVIVCAVCALALILTICITCVLVSKRTSAQKELDESSVAVMEGYDKNAYVVTSGSVLAETEDAGDKYQDETLFIGDSNTVRMYNNGMITVQQFCAEEGLGIQDAATKQIVTFKNDKNSYTIPDAVALMKPRRVIITLGTNNSDGSMSADDFVNNYKTLVQAIQTKYSYTDIIVNAIPPVPAAHSKYSSADQSAIDKYNMALADMCESLNIKFLNSAEAMKDDNGYGNSSYYAENDIHFTMSGIKAMLKYYRTHEYKTEDRRPDTNNIPTRVQAFASAGNTTHVSPTSTAATYTASYLVDKNGGGTLSCGNDTGAAQLSYKVTEEQKSFTVTAVPNSGYFFVGWSDGSKTNPRTDADFKQNVNVSAVFGTFTIAVSGSTTGTLNTAGTYTAKLSSDQYASVDTVVWYDGSTQIATGANCTFTPTTAGKHTLKASVTIGTTIISGAIEVTVPEAATPTPTMGDISGSDSVTAGAATGYTVSVQNAANCTVKWTTSPASGEGSGESFSFTAASAGTYTLTATLYDASGKAIATKTKGVTAVAAPTAAPTTPPAAEPSQPPAATAAPTATAEGQQ